MVRGRAAFHAGESPLFLADGKSGIFAGVFWIMLGGWLHTLNYWDKSERLKKYAPFASNVCMIVSLCSLFLAALTN